METSWSNGKKVVVILAAIAIFALIIAACFVGLQGVN